MGILNGPTEPDKLSFILTTSEPAEANSSAFPNIESSAHEDGSIPIDQAGYIDLLLARCRMADAHSADTPLNSSENTLVSTAKIPKDSKIRGMLNNANEISNMHY